MTRRLRNWWRALRRSARRWLRNRRASAARANTLTVESEAMLDRAHAMARESDALFAQADAEPPLSSEQFRLTFLGYARECDAKALWWRAGGDDEAAAEYETAAADWRVKAAQFSSGNIVVLEDYRHAS
jgi:hypothetical protein